MKSNSQSGQDLWVLEKLNHKRGGTFLDIGCHTPIEINNTYLLESEFGWTGIAFDRDSKYKELWRLTRKTPIIICNALELNWKFLRRKFDYLSLDIDEDQLRFIRAFPWDKIRFKVMTVEHDAYRFGDAVKDEIRSTLESHGYTIDRKDVKVNEPYEDWWVDSRLIKA